MQAGNSFGIGKYMHRFGFHGNEQGAEPFLASNMLAPSKGVKTLDTTRPRERGAKKVLGICERRSPYWVRVYKAEFDMVRQDEDVVPQLGYLIDVFARRLCSIGGQRNVRKGLGAYT